MRSQVLGIVMSCALCALATLNVHPLAAAEPAAAVPEAPDPVAQLVARLDLERYKATIKGLTRFGDRRQGTDRNRAAIDWIGDADFRLGLNAAQTTLGAIARLSGAFLTAPPSH